MCHSHDFLPILAGAVNFFSKVTTSFTSAFFPGRSAVLGRVMTQSGYVAAVIAARYCGTASSMSKSAPRPSGISLRTP